MSSHAVTLELDTDAYFVLTEALSEWATLQRNEADNDPDSAEQRHEWVEVADRLRKHIDSAL